MSGPSRTSNICYHTRLDNDNRTKVVGGVFGGSLDIETANRLVKAHFTVKVKNSGRPVFVDRDGREVSLYMSIHPELTEVGKAAIWQDRIERAQRVQQQEETERQEKETIEDLMEGLTHEEIVRRLKGVPP